jgi:hypothetical protein
MVCFCCAAANKEQPFRGRQSDANDLPATLDGRSHADQLGGFGLPSGAAAACCSDESDSRSRPVVGVRRFYGGPAPSGGAGGATRPGMPIENSCSYLACRTGYLVRIEQACEGSSSQQRPWCRALRQSSGAAEPRASARKPKTDRRSPASARKPRCWKLQRAMPGPFPSLAWGQMWVLCRSVCWFQGDPWRWSGACCASWPTCCVCLSAGFRAIRGGGAACAALPGQCAAANGGPRPRALRGVCAAGPRV